MKLLRTLTAAKRWVGALNRSQPQALSELPKEVPCFAYKTVASFGYEEENAEYLYVSDVTDMLNQLDRAAKHRKGAK